MFSPVESADRFTTHRDAVECANSDAIEQRAEDAELRRFEDCFNDRWNRDDEDPGFQAVSAR